MIAEESEKHSFFCNWKFGSLRVEEVVWTLKTLQYPITNSIISCSVMGNVAGVVWPNSIHSIKEKKDFVCSEPRLQMKLHNLILVNVSETILIHFTCDFE